MGHRILRGDDALRTRTLAEAKSRRSTIEGLCGDKGDSVSFSCPVSAGPQSNGTAVTFCPTQQGLVHSSHWSDTTMSHGTDLTFYYDLFVIIKCHGKKQTLMFQPKNTHEIRKKNRAHEQISPSARPQWRGSGAFRVMGTMRTWTKQHKHNSSTRGRVAVLTLT